MTELEWLVVQACTELAVVFDSLYHPLHPQVLSLPNLKFMWAQQIDKAQIVKEYNLPALEELQCPSVQFLRLLPKKNAIKKLVIGTASKEIIEIIATFDKLETLNFQGKQDENFYPKNFNLKYI